MILLRLSADLKVLKYLIELESLSSMMKYFVGVLLVDGLGLLDLVMSMVYKIQLL